MKAQQLKAWRKAHSLTQTELANYLGISQVTISRWETEVFLIEHGKMLELALRQIEKDLLIKSEK